MDDQRRQQEIEQWLASKGEPAFGRASIAEAIDYVGTLGLTESDVGPLCAIAQSWTSVTEWPEDEEDMSCFAPVHAWRAAAQLKSVEAIDPIVELLVELVATESGDDWMFEDFGGLLALIGPAAMGPLTTLLENENELDDVRHLAADTFAEMGKAHPETRDQCVEILARSLVKYQEQEVGFNAFLLCALKDLRAVEHGELIERAYAAGAFDLPLAGNWEMTRDELELEDHGLVPPEMANQALHGDDEKLWDTLATFAEVERLRLQKQRESVEAQKKHRDQRKKRKRRSR